MTSTRLRSCPECGGGWPVGPDYTLRGMAWLAPLPRNASPSNTDVELHDGNHGPDRFLRLELKRTGEKMQGGQLHYLLALSRQPGWTVRVLQGESLGLSLYQVTAAGYGPPTATHTEAVRRVVAGWLQGRPWDDGDAASANDNRADHYCGWARVDGVWTCLQDYYAVGWAPETSCGRQLEPL
jgi:hypothetical protein